jgi:RimJ/RimL family protein N-acetyltransferase
MSFDNLFSSSRLIYRALENTPEEKDFFYDIINNDPTTFAQSMNRLIRPLSSEDVDKIFGGAADALLSVRVCLPASEDGEKPTTIGWLSLDAHPVSRHHRSCGLGITLATPYQGKGYGTEAITWALDWAFRVAGMHAV